MRRKSRKITRTWAPRIIGARRVAKSVGIDPLHYDELELLAKMAGHRGSAASISYVVDEILMDFFKAHSPRYGEEL
jgi:hypothetical protein